MTQPLAARMLRFAAAVVVITLSLIHPAHAQYGGRSRSLAPGAPAASHFRQSLTAEQASKTASILLDVMEAMTRRRIALSAEAGDWSDLATEMVRVNPAGEIQVYVVVNELRPETTSQLEAAGLRVELVHDNIVQGWAGPGALEAIAALPLVREIRPPGYALQNQSGSVDTAGNAILRANEARAAFGVTGAGVPIGVISTGIDHLPNIIATGDLPPLGTILRAGSGDEGTAMLEIVHDLAPGSPLLFFGTGGGATSLQMAAGIDTLASAGARVVVDDIVFFDQPKFEDGPIAKAARNFATAGRVYVTSANNFARQHYRAQYNPTDSPVVVGARSYARHHGYNPAGDTTNVFVLPAGCRVRIFLQWNNPDGAASDDFDLVLVRATDGVVMAMSQNQQSGSQRAFEGLVWPSIPLTSPQLLFVAIAEFSLTTTASSLTLDYFVLPTCEAGPLTYTVPEASVWGQGAVSEVLSVAAVNADTPSQIRDYSARGPGLISFPSPETRNVPNITAVDGVQTKVGQLGFFGENPFSGTSAAAPHVAAIAALAMERNPTLSSEQVRGFLTNTAVDLGPPGFDFTFGFGRVDAFAAVQAVPPLTTTIALGAAILPSSRSVQVGGTATAFATIINAGALPAVSCGISPATSLLATSFLYQTTNPATNALTGTANTPATILPGASQSYVVAFRPGAAFGSTDVAFNFQCGNSGAAATISGVNTLLLTASSSPAADVIALAATANNTGILNVIGGTGAFAVATFNVGAASTITVNADTGSTGLPVALGICQTNGAGNCIGTAAPSVTLGIGTNATPTFAIFATAGGPIGFDPAANRIFVRFRDGAGVTRGATSVAVRTQ